MKQIKKILWFAFPALFTSSLLPAAASAHEVYVLKPHEIQTALNSGSFSEFSVIAQHLPQFLGWAVGAIIMIALVFFISRIKPLTSRLNPLLTKAKSFAPLIARLTIGLSFLSCARYQAIFGPELPFSTTFGHYSGLVTFLLVAIAILIILGVYTRIAAFIALVIFGVTVWLYNVYMLTYFNYLGEICVLLILGAHNFSIESYMNKWLGAKKPKNDFSLAVKKLRDYLAPRSFLILRILFGMALIYASAYAKIIHNNLALDTVTNYHLDRLFGFEAHFLVVGAALVELLIGIFFVIGFEIRITALFLLSFLTASLLFFGEVVWPHMILIGIPIAYIFYGYDQYSVGRWLTKKDKFEPVL